MKKAFAICAFLFFCNCVTVTLHAQTYDISCPAGTSVLPNGQTLNPTNGHLKAFLCVDSFGNVTSPQVGAGSPALGVTFSPNCPVGGANGCFFAFQDGYEVEDGVTVNGQNTVTSASAHFLTSGKIRVGEPIWTVAGGCFGGAESVNTSSFVTTVATIVSDTQITMAANANANAGSGQCVMWGDDDAANINAGYAYLISAANPNCGPIFFSGGAGYVLGSAVMVTSAPASRCFNSFGDSLSIHATGIGTTNFMLRPDFNWSSCNGNGCFSIGSVPSYSEFNFLGAGLNITSTTLGILTHFITSQSPAAFTNVGMFNFDQNDNNLSCLSSAGNGFSYFYNFECNNFGNVAPSFAHEDGSAWEFFINAGGSTPCTFSAGAPGPEAMGIWCGVFNQYVMNVTGFLRLFGQVENTSGIEVTGGNFAAVGGYNNATGSGAGRASLLCQTSATCRASGYQWLETGTGGTFSVSVDGTSKYFDGCGDTYTGPISVAAGGLFTPCFGTLYPSDVSHPTASGTGPCATITTQKGTIYYGTLVCTAATGAATITLTPGTTAADGFICFAWDRTTTANILASGTPTTTTCPFSAATITVNDVIQFLMLPY